MKNISTLPRVRVITFSVLLQAALFVDATQNVGCGLPLSTLWTKKVAAFQGAL